MIMFNKILMSLLRIIVLISLIMAIYLLILTMNPAKRDYFEIIDDKAIPIYYVNKPIVTNNILLDWSRRAATNIYSFNFLEYEKNLSDVKKYFTVDGYNAFMGSLSGPTGLLTTVKLKKLMVNSVLCAAPSILKHEDTIIDREENHLWKIKVPIIVEYTSPSEIKNEVAIVELIVQLSSSMLHPQGIAINSMQLSTPSVNDTECTYSFNS